MALPIQNVVVPQAEPRNGGSGRRRGGGGADGDFADVLGWEDSRTENRPIRAPGAYFVDGAPMIDAGQATAAANGYGAQGSAVRTDPGVKRGRMLDLIV